MKTLPIVSLLFVSLSAWPLFAADMAPIPVPAKATVAELKALGMGPTIAADAKVIKLQGGFKFTEGATVDKNGDLYFVDQDNNRIHKWSVAEGKLSTFLDPSNRANGQYFDTKGNLIACCDERNELWSIAPDKTHTVLISYAGFEGHPLDGPNDVWVRPDGGLYITDPLYKRGWWDAAVARPAQAIRSIYYLPPDHDQKKLVRVAGVTEKFDSPNGIVGTPDGKTLYVSDLGGDTTRAYDIKPDGTLANGHIINHHGSDGMTIDTQGNLYQTPFAGGSPMGGMNGVTIFSTKEGKVIGFIPVPEQPANLAFGGKDHSTLFFTARTGLYSIETKAKGANAAK